MPETLRCPSFQELGQYLSGQLAEDEGQQVQQHLSGCEKCRRRSQALKEKLANPQPHAVPTGRNPEVEETPAVPPKRAREVPAAAHLRSRLGLRQKPAGERYPTLTAAPEPDEAAEAAAEDLRRSLGGALSPPQSDAEQGWLGHYRILRTLGRGGMGVVLLAEDSQLHRQVALKLMWPMMVNDDTRKRFLREAQAAATVENDHVITIHHVGEENGLPYLVMPVLKGISLADWLNQGRKVPIRQILRLGREIATGLAAAHEKKLIHRDIKPSNLWLEAPSGRIKILDFGLARVGAEPTRLTQSGYVMGTPGYMPPEQALGKAVDARADLFSLGVVLYEICSGELPFQGASTPALLLALVQEPPIPLLKKNSSIPPPLAKLVMQLLARDPADRPQSAQEVVERIQAIEAALPAQATQAQATAVRANPRPEAPLEVTPDRGRRKANSARPRHEPTALHRASSRRPARPAKSQLRARWLSGALLLALTAGVGCWALLPPLSEEGGAPVQGTPVALNAPTPVLPSAQKVKRPVKVFLLAGQSNMAGRAPIRTLDWLGEDPKYGGLLKLLKNPNGTWRLREDVWVYAQANEQQPRCGPLTVGYGESERQDEIGPGLMFGHVMGDHFDNQVLLLQLTLGPLRLGVEGRPPSSGGIPGPFYRKMLATTREVLADLKKPFPEYQGEGCELAGFVWFQGFNDMIKPNWRDQYEANLVNLIKDMRKDLGLPHLPVVVGELGVDGRHAKKDVLAFRKAQAAAVARPEFQGNVALVKTSESWDEQAQALLDKGFVGNRWVDEKAKAEFDRMGSSLPFLYMGSGKVLSLIGNGFAEAMKELLVRQAGALSQSPAQQSR